MPGKTLFYPPPPFFFKKKLKQINNYIRIKIKMEANLISQLKLIYSTFNRKKKKIIKRSTEQRYFKYEVVC